MSTKKYFHIAALCVVVAVVLSAFAPAASATIIHYNRDYAEHETVTLQEEEEALTAVFTNLLAPDAAVPSNSASDLANGKTAYFINPNDEHSASGGVGMLTDGVLGGNGDDYQHSCFLKDDTNSAIGLDMGSIYSIAQVNTYSWHSPTSLTGSRAPQKYELLASDGTASGFDKLNPDGPGWTSLASVNCVPVYGSDIAGGQYGVSVRGDAAGVSSMGDYRYFIFRIYQGEHAGDATFYQEIDIVGVPEPSTLALLAAGLIGLLAYAWKKRK